MGCRASACLCFFRGSLRPRERAIRPTPLLRAGPEQMPECGGADVAEREARPRGGSKSLQGGQPKARDETPAVEMAAVMEHGVSRIRDLATTHTADEVTHIVCAQHHWIRKWTEVTQIVLCAGDAHRAPAVPVAADGFPSTLARLRSMRGPTGPRVSSSQRASSSLNSNAVPQIHRVGATPKLVRSR